MELEENNTPYKLLQNTTCPYCLPELQEVKVTVDICSSSVSLTAICQGCKREWVHRAYFNKFLPTNIYDLRVCWKLVEEKLNEILKRGDTICHGKNFSTIWQVVSSMHCSEDIEAEVFYEMVNFWLLDKPVVFENNEQIFYGLYGVKYQPIYNEDDHIEKVVFDSLKKEVKIKLKEVGNLQIAIKAVYPTMPGSLLSLYTDAIGKEE
jgi:hypothetical protein